MKDVHMKNETKSEQKTSEERRTCNTLPFHTVFPDWKERNRTVVRFSPDGRTLLLGEFNGIVTVFDADTLEELHTLRRKDDCDRLIHRLWFSDDGKYFFTESLSDGITAKWDAKDLSFCGRATQKDLHRYRSQILYDEPIAYRTQYSPDGSCILKENGQSYSLFRAADGSLIQTFVPEPGPNVFRFTPDGKHLLSVKNGSWYSDVALWDIGNGRVMARVNTDENLTAACFSPDGKNMVAAYEFGDVCFYSLPGLQKNEAFSYTEEDVVDDMRFICFSPDGSLFLTFGISLDECTVTARDAVTLHKRWKYVGPRVSDPYNRTCFRPDGKALAIIDTENALRLIDAADGHVMAAL